MKKVITMEMVEKYQNYLKEEEKSQSTIEKYVRDMKKLMKYMNGREVTKSLMIEYKNSLLSGGNYQVCLTVWFGDGLTRREWITMIL